VPANFYVGTATSHRFVANDIRSLLVLRYRMPNAFRSGSQALNDCRRYLKAFDLERSASL
jgi:hypothetical protein